MNLPGIIANGYPMRARTSKSRGKVGRRDSSWSVESNSSNLGTGTARFEHGNPVIEERQSPPNERVFNNHLHLPTVGGNEYTVKVKKVHEDSARLAKGTKSTTVAGAKTVAWRKVYFTLTCMQGMSARANAPALSVALTELFNAAFIELTEAVQPNNAVIATEAHTPTSTLQALVGTLPQAPFSSQPPANNHEAHYRWLRIMLVERVVTDPQVNESDVGAQQQMEFTNQAWTIAVPAPTKRVFIASSIQELNLNVAPSFALTDLETTFTVVYRDGSPSRHRQTIVAVSTNRDLLEALRVHNKTGADLTLDPIDSRAVRFDPVEIVADNESVTITVKAVGRISLGKNLWEKATHRVVLQVSSTKLTFDAAGVEASNYGTRVINDNGLSAKITVTNNNLNGLLSTFVDGESGPGTTLTVKTKSYGDRAGNSRGANIAVAVETLMGRARDPLTGQKAISIAVAHEIAHSIGIVRATEDNLNHGKFYAPKFGGSATGEIGHCAHKATLTDAETLRVHTDAEKKKTWEPNKPQIYVPNSSRSGICVMYHRGYLPPFANATFCSHCIKQLRLRGCAEVDWQIAY